jgi:hypothetical protein
MDHLIKKVYQLFEDNNQELIDKGLQPVGTIDRYRGQTLNPEQFEYYAIPAIFIGWRIKWERNGKTYKGNASIDFHIVTEEPWGTDNKSTNVDDALKNAFFHKAVQKMLDDLESEDTGKLQRGDDVPVDTGVICYTILGYNCTVYDEVGTDTFQLSEDLTLNITGKLKRKFLPSE